MRTYLVVSENVILGVYGEALKELAYESLDNVPVLGNPKLAVLVSKKRPHVGDKVPKAARIIK